MKLCNRKCFYLMVLFGIGIALAGCSSTGKSIGVNTDGNGLALRGFDAVAYFAVENAVKGDGKYEYVWNGAKWLFSSEENMKMFQANPDMYSPQFGGYCSYAVSKGYTANGDPEAWKIVDGKLYLNYSPEVKKLWEQDQQQRIIDGEKNWVEFTKKKPEHKG
jgi:YHS domain-containing protein